MHAHTLGEVGILGTVLLRVYSGTILQIFTEIGSYSTDMEQKVSWQFFSETQVSFDYMRIILKMKMICPLLCSSSGLWFRSFLNISVVADVNYLTPFFALCNFNILYTVTL